MYQLNTRYVFIRCSPQRPVTVAGMDFSASTRSKSVVTTDTILGAQIMVCEIGGEIDEGLDVDE